MFKHFHIAKDQNGKVIGIIGLEFEKSEGLLRSLVVSENSRGLGIGKNLVNCIEDYAKSMGITKLTLHTNSAEKFLENLGYKRISKKSVSNFINQTAEFSSICPESSICMQKSMGEEK